MRFKVGVIDRRGQATNIMNTRKPALDPINPERYVFLKSAMSFSHAARRSVRAQAESPQRARQIAVAP